MEHTRGYRVRSDGETRLCQERHQFKTVEEYVVGVCTGQWGSWRVVVSVGRTGGMVHKEWVGAETSLLKQWEL